MIHYISNGAGSVRRFSLNASRIRSITNTGRTRNGWKRTVNTTYLIRQVCKNWICPEYWNDCGGFFYINELIYMNRTHYRRTGKWEKISLFLLLANKKTLP